MNVIDHQVNVISMNVLSLPRCRCADTTMSSCHALMYMGGTKTHRTLSSSSLQLIASHECKTGPKFWLSKRGPSAEFGRGRVCGEHVPIHAPAGLPGREDLHPDHVQWTEGADQGRGGEAVCEAPRLWQTPEGKLLACLSSHILRARCNQLQQHPLTTACISGRPSSHHSNRMATRSNKHLDSRLEQYTPSF